MRCHAGNSVCITKGFHAQSGSSFHAYIDPLACVVIGGGSSGMAIYDSDNYQNIDGNFDLGDNTETLTLEQDVQSYIIYPNPNSGKFRIKGLNSANTSIKIFTLSGSVIYQTEVAQNEELDLELLSGVYILEIHDTDNKVFKKIIIQ